MSENLTEADRQRLTDWWWTNYEAAPGNAEELHALVEEIAQAAAEKALRASGDVGTGGGGDSDPAQTEATPWVNRSDDCPEAHPQAHVPATEHVIWDDDDGDWCEHPEAAVISDVNGDHLCAVCNAEWWEDPL